MATHFTKMRVERACSAPWWWCVSLRADLNGSFLQQSRGDQIGGRNLVHFCRGEITAECISFSAPPTPHPTPPPITFFSHLVKFIQVNSHYANLCLKMQEPN